MASGTNSLYQFYEYDRVYDAVTDAQEDCIVGQIDGNNYSNNFDQASAFAWERDCTSSGCGQQILSGDFGITARVGVSPFVGTAVSAVPLPAGFPLLIAGLGAFALLRRKIA